MSVKVDPSKDCWKKLGKFIERQQAQFSDPQYIAESKPELTLSLNIRQGKKIDKWGEEHIKTCPYVGVNENGMPKDGAIGGAITISFTATSLGIVAKVTCACGGEVDVTDYQEW
jgi:hypothetical protein